MAPLCSRAIVSYSGERDVKAGLVQSWEAAQVSWEKGRDESCRSADMFCTIKRKKVCTQYKKKNERHPDSYTAGSPSRTQRMFIHLLFCVLGRNKHNTTLSVRRRKMAAFLLSGAKIGATALPACVCVCLLLNSRRITISNDARHRPHLICQFIFYAKFSSFAQYFER